MKKIINLITAILLMTEVSFAATRKPVPKSAPVDSTLEKTVDKSIVTIKRDRPYAGGHDEEDIRVQEAMNTPTVTIDRHAIETRVLKNYFKKGDDVVAPDAGGASSMPHPPNSDPEGE